MYSFDIFDTLITRRTAAPQGIFALMQEELARNDAYTAIPEAVRRNFYSLRTEAEGLARFSFQRGETDDVTLVQIYRALALRGELEWNDCEKLMSLECETEYRESAPLEENIRFLRQLVERGERVILISDMYLPADQIKRMLEKADPLLGTLELFLSSEYKKGKYTGRLYRLVNDRFGDVCADWTHVGDNERVDGAAARQFGIKTRIIGQPPLLSAEKALLSAFPGQRWTQRMTGCGRLARIRLGDRAKESAAVRVGASVGGMLLFPYVSWILRRCGELKIKSLYFIARDGYVLKRIADIIIDAEKLAIETHELYGSRMAWRMAAFAAGKQDLMTLMEWSHISRLENIGDLAEVLQLPADALRKYLPVPFAVTQPLPEPILREAIRMLENAPGFWDCLKSHHAKNRRLAQKYLAQEIDFAAGGFAFVDLGGSGYTQACLAEIIRDLYPGTVRTFFMKLDTILPGTEGGVNCIIESFLPGKLLRSVVLEMLCRAPQDQTAGYREKNGRAEPVFSELSGEKDAIIAHGFMEYLEGVLEFTRTACEAGEPNELEDIGQLKFLFEYVTRTPDPELLEFLGDMPDSVTGRERQVIPFAPKLNRKQLKKVGLCRTPDAVLRAYPGTCLDYSLLRCTKAERKKMEFYRRHCGDFTGKWLRGLEGLHPPAKKYRWTEGYPMEFMCGDIILYAAGSMGRELYRRISREKSGRVVQWLDKNPAGKQHGRNKVQGLADIGECTYDIVVIAVRKKSTADEIREELKAKGVAERKILWFDPYRQWKRS